jgi:hypothetical protein
LPFPGAAGEPQVLIKYVEVGPGTAGNWAIWAHAGMARKVNKERQARKENCRFITLIIKHECPQLAGRKQLLDVVDITLILFGRKAKARENF